jgi:gliding motility-associated-like protein
MKNIINHLSICILLVLLGAQTKVYAQPGVPPAPYCLAPYGAVPCNQPNPPNTPGNGINDFIDSFVTLGGIVDINNMNSTCNTQTLPGLGQVNYMYFGCQHYLQTVPNAVITCSIRSGTGWAQGFSFWVDWNQDNVFQNPAERVAWTPVPGAFTWITTNFTVPAGQPAGVYRLRVRCIWAQAGSGHTPCNATTYGEVEDYNLYVSMPPPGALTATASVNTPICSGQAASFSVASSYTGALTYTWTGPAAFTSTLQNPIIPNCQPTNSGIYTVVVSPGSCPVTKTVQLWVNPTPTVNPTNNGPICQGGTLNLSVNAVTGGTAVAYTWMGPGSYQANVQNPTLANAQPTNSGVYTVTAANSFTTGNVCQASNTTTVGIVPVNPTTVTPSFTLCQGDVLNLTAANAAPPTAYSWTGPAGFTSMLQNPSINNVMPPVAGDYIVTAAFATPGIMLVCTSTAVTNVSVVATSPVTVTVPNNICQYDNAIMSATTNPPAQAYSWVGPDGFSASVSNTNIANIFPTATGLYSVTAMWSIGTKSCTIKGYNQINVVPIGDISINPPLSVCYPANVQLLSSSPGAISYNWTASTGFTSNLANPLMGSPTPTASGFYTVTTAYTNGALICYNSNTTQVTVNPILPFSLAPYKQVCYNNTYSVPGPAGATSYTWTGPNNFYSYNQDLVIPTMQTAMAGNYTLTVHLGPCTTSASTNVDVLTPIEFAQTPGNKVICAGDKVDLFVHSKGGSQNYAYNWNPVMYLASPTGSMQLNTQPEGTMVYNITGYDITCPNYTISTAFTITVNKAPAPVLNLERTEGCQPVCLTFDSQTQNDAALITYDFGNGNLIQNDNFNYCFTEPGTYNLLINTRGKNGCSATFAHPAPINVWPIPHTELTWSPDPATTTQNQVTFDPNALYGPVVRYQWEFQGAVGASGYDTSALRNPTRIYDNVGKYPVMVISTTDKGCVDTAFKVIEVRDEFTIFIPNTFSPNGDGLNDVFNIKGLGLKTEGYSMDIFDRWGALVYSTKDAFKGWDGTIKGINAENGVYVYKVRALGAHGEGKKEFVGHVTLIK